MTTYHPLLSSPFQPCGCHQDVMTPITQEMIPLSALGQDHLPTKHSHQDVVTLVRGQGSIPVGEILPINPSSCMPKVGHRWKLLQDGKTRDPWGVWDTLTSFLPV